MSRPKVDFQCFDYFSVAIEMALRDLDEGSKFTAPGEIPSRARAFRIANTAYGEFLPVVGEAGDEAGRDEIATAHVKQLGPKVLTIFDRPFANWEDFVRRLGKVFQEMVDLWFDVSIEIEELDRVCDIEFRVWARKFTEILFNNLALSHDPFLEPPPVNDAVAGLAAALEEWLKERS